MAQRATILDGLAWAGLSEKVRVARISAGLVRSLVCSKVHTKAAIHAAVRDTCPPHGRGKAIIEAVTLEYQRQLPIYRARQENHASWKAHLEHQAKRETRLNNAYAHAFGRPVYKPDGDYPGSYWDDPWEIREKWDAKERARDKGEKCLDLLHYRGHVVCLAMRPGARPHIATIGKDKTIVLTYLPSGHYNTNDSWGRYLERQTEHAARYYTIPPSNLLAAAVLLGGPEVKTAMTLGKKVETDWVGRKTIIHHEGQDHRRHCVEEIPWPSIDRD
jgi:hypothetical protein